MRKIIFPSGLYPAALAIWALLLAAQFAWGAESKQPAAAANAAIVNGTAVSMSEFEGELLVVQKVVLGAGKPLTCARLSSLRSDVIESLVRRELLFQEGRKAGIKAGAADVEKEIAAIKKQFLSEAEFKNELARRDVSEEAFRARLEKNLIIQKFVETRFTEKLRVSDAEMIAYYAANIDYLKQPLQARLSHILIQSDPQWDDSRKKEARRKAEQVLKDLKKGKDFAALAREHSNGPTKASGGDLGYVRMGQLERKLESAVFNLKAGDVSEIIETEYGFHIFKVADMKPETVLAYENVKEQIRRVLLQEKAKQEADLYVRGLREKAKVEILVKD